MKGREASGQERRRGRLDHAVGEWLTQIFRSFRCIIADFVFTNQGSRAITVCWRVSAAKRPVKLRLKFS